MKISDFDYSLPEDLIAQEPLADRDASRLMLVDKRSGAMRDLQFRDLPQILQPSDFLVLNDSAVFPARLLGKRAGGGRVELLLLQPGLSRQTEASRLQPAADLLAGNQKHALWEALARPKRKLRPNMDLIFSDELRGRVVEVSDETVKVEFSFPGDFDGVLDRTAHIPLPPYICRPDREEDRGRYQTVYARQRGSIAAPTAGLHFTPVILDQLRRRDIDCFFITLHVGYGTFRPLKSDSIEQHKIGPESFSISTEAAAGIRGLLQSGRRLVAVGTTTTRVLEHWQKASPGLHAVAGRTDLFVYPPFDFRLVRGLLTNFHLPRSSLFALVCAFLGTEFTHRCYRHAVEQRYRFYSYGDCMLIM